MISTTLHLFVLLKGRVSISRTVSPMLHSILLVMSMVFLRLVHEFTIDRVFLFHFTVTVTVFSILLLETTPTLSFLKFLLSILDMWLIIFY